MVMTMITIVMMSAIMTKRILKTVWPLLGAMALLPSAMAQSFWQPLDEVHPQSHLALATVTINDQPIRVELATKPHAQAYGLMHRYILPENQGMLFVFDKMQPLSFWMKNTKIPLDILYFDNEGVLVDYAEAIPCLEDPCPSYPSKAPGQYVLEIGQGERARLGINIGDRLKKVD